MIYTKMTQEAMKICFEVHIEQKDKSGIPYVFHPIHLAEQMETEETIIVALLHDVVEDSDYSIEDLRKKGFSDAVLEAISLMTHADGVNYMDYVRPIKNNPIARVVKLADLRHNSDLTRLEVVDEKALERRNRYQEAIAFLEE